MNHGLINTVYYKSISAPLEVKYPLAAKFRNYFIKRVDRDAFYIAMKYEACQRLVKAYPDISLEMLGWVINTTGHVCALRYTSKNARNRYKPLPNHEEIISNRFNYFIDNDIQIKRDKKCLTCTIPYVEYRI